MDGIGLFTLLLLSRVPILMLFILSDWALRDYDTSTAILGQLCGFRGEVDRYCGEGTDDADDGDGVVADTAEDSRKDNK